MTKKQDNCSKNNDYTNKGKNSIKKLAYLEFAQDYISNIDTQEKFDRYFNTY